MSHLKITFIVAVLFISSCTPKHNLNKKVAEGEQISNQSSQNTTPTRTPKIIKRTPINTPIQQNSIEVDIVRGTIGGINYREDINEIREKIGDRQITTETEFLEGDPHDVYVINLKGHSFYKHWNQISFKDPIFKFKGSNLGIGSKAKEFEAVYGKPFFEIAFHWQSEQPKYFFSLTLPPINRTVTGESLFDPEASPTEIWVN